jgi:hypothetical protein
MNSFRSILLRVYICCFILVFVPFSGRPFQTVVEMKHAPSCLLDCLDAERRTVKATLGWIQGSANDWIAGQCLVEVLTCLVNDLTY